MDHNNTLRTKSEMSFDTTQIPIFSDGPCSASEHNVFLTYVCLVNHGIPGNSNADKNENSAEKNAEEESNGDIVEPIQVERSKAVHELVESNKKIDDDKNYKPTTESSEESEGSDQDNYKYDNPKVLKLTKMKWLSEDQSGYPDSSTPSVSSARSTTSSLAEDSDNDIVDKQNVGEKCLSTILRLDKEHNLFGLSSIAIIGSKQSPATKQNKSQKDDEKPVFHQTAIVQVCCRKSCSGGSGCCRYKSKTDLPCSLKFSSNCFSTCTSACTPPMPLPPRPRPNCCGSIRLGAPLVPPPTCALIPRVPRIHVSCLPETGPLKKPNCKSKCRDPCSPATDPLNCVPSCNPRSGALSRPVGMCTISKDPVCRMGTPGECCHIPPRKKEDSESRHEDSEPCDEDCFMSDLPPCMQQCTCGLSAFIPPGPPDCCFGLRLKLNRRTLCKPPPVEVTPRCASESQKPMMARICDHNPCCRPPTAAFPYLMPCFWPCRPSAPCIDPLKCFHHPKCLPPYRHKGIVPPEQICPKVCKDPENKTECQNKSCLGKSKEFIQGLKKWGDIGKEEEKQRKEKEIEKEKEKEKDKKKGKK